MDRGVTVRAWLRASLWAFGQLRVACVPCRQSARVLLTQQQAPTASPETGLGSFFLWNSS